MRKIGIGRGVRLVIGIGLGLAAAGGAAAQDVSTPGVQPLVGSAGVAFPNAQSNAYGTLLLRDARGPVPDVPAGKRFVGQFLSVRIGVPQGQKVQFTIHNRLAGGGGSHMIALGTPYTINGLDYYVTSQPVLVFLDGRTNAEFVATRFPTAGEGFVNVTLTGTTVDQ